MARTLSKDRKPRPPYRIRVGERFVARFEYPEPGLPYGKVDKRFEALEGIKIASHCKAILGTLAHSFDRYESALHVAASIPEAVVEHDDCKERCHGNEEQPR